MSLIRVRRTSDNIVAMMLLLIIVVYCGIVVSATEAVIGTPADAEYVAGEVQRAIINVQRGVHGSKAAELRCVGCHFGQCAVGCLATDRCAGFDFLADSGTCYTHSVETVCRPLIERPNATHYRRVKCGGQDNQRNATQLHASSESATTAGQYATTVATSGGNDLVTDADIITQSPSTIQSAVPDRLAVTGVTTAVVNSSQLLQEADLKSLTSKLLALLSKETAVSASIVSVLDAAGAESSTTAVTQPIAASMSFTGEKSNPEKSSTMSLPATPSVTDVSSGGSAVPVNNNTATLPAVPAISPSGIRRLNVLASIARATRDSMSLGTFAGLARSLLADVPPETVNDLILNKHRLDVLGNSSDAGINSVAEATAVAEAWKVGLVKPNVTGVGATGASMTILTGPSTPASAGGTTEQSADGTIRGSALSQKMSNDEPKSVDLTITGSNLNLGSLAKHALLGLGGQGANNERTSSAKTLQSLTARFGSPSTSPVPDIVTSMPTPSVEIATSTTSSTPLVSGTYFAMDHQAIADLVANIIINKGTPSTSNALPPRGTTESTSKTRPSTRAAKARTAKNKSKYNQTPIGLRGAGNAVLHRAQESTTTLPPTPTMPVHDDYETNYDDDIKQMPSTIGPSAAKRAKNQRIGNGHKVANPIFLSEAKPITGSIASANSTKYRTLTGIEVQQWRKVESDGRKRQMAAKSGANFVGELTTKGASGVWLPWLTAPRYQPLREPTRSGSLPETWPTVTGVRNEQLPEQVMATDDRMQGAYNIAEHGSTLGEVGDDREQLTQPARLFPIPTKIPRGWNAYPDRRVSGSAYVIKDVGGGDRCVEECASGKRTCLAVDYDTTKDECWIYDDSFKACGPLASDVYFYHIKALRCSATSSSSSAI